MNAITQFWESLFASKHTMHINIPEEHVDATIEILSRHSCRERNAREVNDDRTVQLCYLAPGRELGAVVAELTAYCNAAKITARPYSLFSNWFENR